MVIAIAPIAAAAMPIRTMVRDQVMSTSFVCRVRKRRANPQELE
jgi:hypothetical protein